MAASTDSVTDPATAAKLLLARRGQAYFSRALRELREPDFDAPSLVPGWSRREIVAHVGLNARALTPLVTWAHTGVETPMYSSPTQRDTDIAITATLPVEALRHLSDHAAVHLNVEWRDLPEPAWSREVRTGQGRIIPVSETAWMRAREVWIHAVDLDNGADFTDFAGPLLDRLLTDVITAWRRHPSAGGIPRIILQPIDGGAPRGVDLEDRDATVVTGTTAHLAQWCTGRGSHGVQLTDGSTPAHAPRWL